MFDHFGWIAPFYDRFASVLDPRKLIGLAGMRKDGQGCGRVLDVGGGTGRVAQGFLGCAEQVVVADVSTGMLAQAHRKTGLQPVEAESEHLPFPANLFDAVIMVDALHHVADHAQTADEMFRVLKPGGRLVIEELDVRTLPVKLIVLGEKLLLMRSHLLSPARIAALFSQPSAQVRMEGEGINAWIIVEKIENRKR